jgi:hypothetical protein
MANQNQPTDGVAKRATELRDLIEGQLAKPNNGVNGLIEQLRSLSYTLARVPQWLARTNATPMVRNLAEVAVIHLEPAINLIPAIPMHGPELASKTEEVRPMLAAALATLLAFGIGALEKDEGEIAAMEGQVNGMLAAQKKEYDAVIAEARGAVEMAKKAAEQATESAKKVGVTVQMTAFAVARDSHQKLAGVWEKRTAAVAVLLLGAAVVEIFFGSGPPDGKGSWYVAGNLSHYLARALAVSLISYLLVLCTKNFRAAKHNEIVNGHRAWALATFDTLRTPSNKTLDDAIMLQVAGAVFTPQPSGYDGSETSGTHITELLGPILKKFTDD